MYNRYIPQNDGSYRRSRIQEPQPPRPEPPAPPIEPPEPVEAPPCRQNCPARPIPPKPKGPPVSLGSFFRQLMPGGFDTEDLMVVLLLLLMAGDSREDSNFPLLTLALYLFL